MSGKSPCSITGDWKEKRGNQGMLGEMKYDCRTRSNQRLENLIIPALDVLNDQVTAKSASAETDRVCHC